VPTDLGSDMPWCDDTLLGVAGWSRLDMRPICSLKGLNRSISCGFEPDTGKFLFFSSAFKSLTAKANNQHPAGHSYNSGNQPFISSNLETVLKLSGVGGGKEGVAGGAGDARDARLLTGDGTLIMLGTWDEQLLCE
jgi:hypothetical protein